MQKLKRIVLIAANALCLLCLIAGVIALSGLRGTLDSQKAAVRWRGENENAFAQVSAFFPLGGEVKEDAIRSFRSSLETKFAEAGLEQPENGRLWADSYCSIGTARVSGARGSSEATAVGIGGDFFLFHPLQLYDGQYISGSDLMKDRVVIDKTLAWKLYGGMELAGMPLTVNGEECIIAGVVELESDFATSKALKAGTPMIFMAYERMTTDSAENAEAGASAYEIVMPNPLSGYALGIMEQGIGAADTVQVVENSRRFSFAELREVIADFGSRAMRQSALVLPYWENAAIYVESCMALVWVLMLLFAILPCVTLAFYAAKLYVYGKQQAKRGIRSAGEKLEARREKRWFEKQQGKRVAGRTPVHSATHIEVPVASEPEPDVESIVREIMQEKAADRE